MDIDKLLEDKETVSNETVQDEDVRISPRTGKPVQQIGGRSPRP